MTVRELYFALDKKIPASLSCPWDNDGLMCCPDGAREVKRVLIALDVTAEVADEAVRGGYDCIISHHPFIFKGLRSLDGEEAVSAKAIRLIGAGISVMSFHTRLDAAGGGVNDTLCALLGLEDVSPVFEEGIPLGRIGSLPVGMSAEELAARVKRALGSPFVLLADAGVEARRVAVVGGSGKDMIGAAAAAGADTFVSGRFDYHPMTDARDEIRSPMNLLEAGHFYTENPVCSVIGKMLSDIDAEIEYRVLDSNKIKAV